jgi:hypothetical protein
MLSILIDHEGSALSLMRNFSNLMPAVIDGIFRDVVVIGCGHGLDTKSDHNIHYLCQEAGAELVQNNHDPSSRTFWQKGAEATQGEWVLCLKACHCVSPAGWYAISSFISYAQSNANDRGRLTLSRFWPLIVSNKKIVSGDLWKRSALLSDAQPKPVRIGAFLTRSVPVVSE